MTTNNIPWSPEQLTFFDALRTSSRSIMLVASAGSGKSTTILHGATEILPPHLNILMLAFNKNIETELTAKLPQRIAAATFHKTGYAALRRALPKTPRVDGDKLKWLAKDNLPEKEFKLNFSSYGRLVGLAKNAGIGVLEENHHTAWRTLISHHNLDLGDSDDETIIKGARKLLAWSNSDTTRVDFDDMLYLPLLLNAPFDKRSAIFVDEAQDTNALQRALLQKMLGPGTECPTCHGSGIEIDQDYCMEREEDDDPHASDSTCSKCDGAGKINAGRLIAVGDPSQAIYGFRGADSAAMLSLRNAFNCVVLPLSVSFRCSRAVVAEAQKFDGGIEL